MCSHQASEQLIGYLYQVRYALLLLLGQDESSYQISIEKFDDVSFDDEGTPKELIQLKHHVGAQGSLSNTSVDLWRTLKVWMDAVCEDDSLIDQTDFLLITTAVAPENSAAYNLRQTDRKIEEAYDALKIVAEEKGNTTNKAAYEKFLEISKEKMLNLLDKVSILDQSVNIINAEKDIKKYLKYTCSNSKTEDFIFERLEGWWFRSTITALLSDTPVFINQNQVRERINQYAQEYYEDNLPIDEDILNIVGIDESAIPVKNQIFLEQLKLLNCSDKRLRIALSDYYRAFQQRSKWVRDDLLYINELDSYERRLIDAWNDAFLTMCELIEEEEIEDENEIIKKGRELYRKTMDQQIHIRALCRESFVMKGSYHILANSLKVGWHKDFADRLSDLLSEERL